MTKTLISTSTVAVSGATEIVLTGIPQTGYSDLVVTLSTRDSTNNPYNNVFMTFNNTTSGYSDRVMYSYYTAGLLTTSNASSDKFAFLYSCGIQTPEGCFSNNEIYISNYAASANKAVHIEATAESSSQLAFGAVSTGLWSNSAGVSSIKFTAPAGSFFYAGSTASVYGIKNAVQAYPKATGGMITSSGGYIYHTFTSSGTFTPTTALTADVLIIAGGGGGGVGYAGGGGAGGYVYSAAQSLTATPRTVVVGAGGAGANKTGYISSSNGSNSTFTGQTTAVGGGSGGGRTNVEFQAQSGGSGGGGDNEDFPRTGAAGTAGQGNAGGNGSPNNYYAGGGGGGAGGVGASAGNSYAGVPGGIGLNTLASWAAATGTGDNGYYAGGGGGGMSSNGPAGTNPGGAGGGGYGGRSSDGTDGMKNTGGGGGGGSNKGGTGGSGLVIVRYAA